MGTPPENKMLPLFYQQFLHQRLGQDKAIFLQILLSTLQTQHQVCLERLAVALPLPITTESRRKALQRFLLWKPVCLGYLWLPLLAQIIERYAENPNCLVLAIDRTNWWKYNLLMVSLIWNKRALPVFWRLLKHDGCSSVTERKSVLLPVFKFFRTQQLIVLGDREFGGVKFAQWLSSQKVLYCLRLKESVLMQQCAQQPWQALSEIALKPGQCVWYEGVCLVKHQGISGANVAGKRGFKPESKEPYHEPWWLLTNLASAKEAIERYACRWGIEEMFRDCKSGGYNLEKLRMHSDRFHRLLIVLAIAMSVAVVQGIELTRRGVQRYVTRRSQEARSVKRQSTFRVGINKEVWLSGLEHCQELMESLIDLRRKWLKQYQQGQRARKLLLCSS